MTEIDPGDDVLVTVTNGLTTVLSESADRCLESERMTPAEWALPVAIALLAHVEMLRDHCSSPEAADTWEHACRAAARELAVKLREVTDTHGPLDTGGA